VAGTAIRLAYLGEPMRYDEAYSFLHYARLPVGQIVDTYDLPNNQVLNSLLMHFSYYRLGNHVWVLRLPALLAGMAVPLAGYWAARELYDRDAALWTTGLAAAASPLVDFSVNARGYELAALFVFLALAFGARVARRWSAAATLGFAACGALALWAVPTAAYGLVVVGIWMAGTVLLARHAKAAAIGRVAAALALTALVAYVLYRPLLGQPGWKSVAELPRTGGAIHGLADTTWSLWWRATFHPVDWLIAAAALASVVWHRRLARRGVPLAAAWLLGVTALLAIGPLGPFPRSWLALLPPFLVAAGAGFALIVRLSARRLADAGRVNAAAALVLTAVLGIGVLRAGQAGSEEPPQSDNHLVPALREILRPGERVLVDQPRFGAGIEYYLDRAGYRVETGRVTPRDEADGHVRTIVPRDHGALALAQVDSLGGHPTGGRPRVVRQLSYIGIYDVEVHRPHLLK
jgi:hypothetical protein